MGLTHVYDLVEKLTEILSHILGLRLASHGYDWYVFLMELFHADIRLPEGFVAPTARVPLRWTRHADEARKNDRYGDIPRFKTATLRRLSVVEVGVENGKVVKILFRGRLDDTRDVCMVLIPGREWTVKTVWVNERNDAHKTLDRSRYVA